MKWLIGKINTWIQTYNRKHHTKKTYYQLRPEIEDLFKQRGEGLYVCNLKSKSNNIVAKAIGIFSRYRNPQGTARLSHTVVIYYGNVAKFLDSIRYDKLRAKLDYYYLNAPQIEDIKALVLASADDTGMNYFSFATYQMRDFSLRKINTGWHDGDIVCWLIDQADINYDTTGLVFWPLYKMFKFLRFFDDSSSWFCSEITYKAFFNYGILVAVEDDPSPADIERYNDHYPNVYRTQGFLS